MTKKYWFLFIHITSYIEPKVHFKNSTHADPHGIANISNIFKSDDFKWTNNYYTESKEEYDDKVKEIETVFNPFIQKIY